MAWGWILISLVLPIIAPFVGLLIFLPFKRRLKGGVPHPVNLVKDGQLGWFAVGFCGSALYEIFVPNAGMGPATGAEYGLTIAGAFFIMYFSGTVAAGGTVLPTPYPRPETEPFWWHYMVLIASFVLVLISGLLYGLVHYGKVGVRML